MIMKNYLFDFDGTLADSMPTFVGVMLRVMRENGLTPSDTPREKIKKESLKEL